MNQFLWSHVLFNQGSVESWNCIFESFFNDVIFPGLWMPDVLVTLLTFRHKHMLKCWKWSCLTWGGWGWRTMQVYQGWGLSWLVTHPWTRMNVAWLMNYSILRLMVKGNFAYSVEGAKENLAYFFCFNSSSWHCILSCQLQRLQLL
jgi:hypothetical protein